ncbi:MAG: ImmA/IrrE family metallo-endopeptidase [Thermoleophilia bacterium]
MSTNEYYRSLETLANLKRQEHEINEDNRMSLSLMRKVYRKEGVRIDTAPRRLKKVRAAYFCDDGDYSVLISPHLPNEPKLFSLGHELKHHLVDQDLMIIYCFDVTSQSDRVEIGAEIFAAEFIFPAAQFIQCSSEIGISQGNCSAEDVCRLKEEYSIPLSYQAICKRLYILKIVPRGHFDKIQFTKVHEIIYGEPLYKRINRHRRSKRVLH